MRKGSGNLAEVPSTEKSACVRIMFLRDYDAIRDRVWFFGKDIGHAHGNSTLIPRGTIIVVSNIPIPMYERNKNAVNAYGYCIFKAKIIPKETKA